MRLLIDVGNTRAKWALSDGRGLHDHAVASHADLTASLQAYLAIHGTGVTAAVVANVAGALIAESIVRVVAAGAHRQPLFLQSTRELGGIRNAYRAPERLGIDRLVAMIGARQTYAGPLCVVCVGTALTIDAIDSSGQHLGGLIVPGPDLMVSSLIASTHEIGPRAAAGARNQELLADDTRGAIEQGAEQALAGFIDRVSSKLHAKFGEPPVVVMTGGAADSIAALLVQQANIVPDLALRGLSVVADELSSP